jgi:ABC-type Na+ efflux pump permease subunit
MKTARLSSAQRNAAIAGVSLLVTASYWWLLHSFTADVHEHSPRGYEGEAAFILVIPIYFLFLYAGFFSLVALERVMRRTHEPMPRADLLLGLLPMWLWPLWLLSKAL